MERVQYIPDSAQQTLQKPAVPKVFPYFFFFLRTTHIKQQKYTIKFYYCFNHFGYFFFFLLLTGIVNDSKSVTESRDDKTCCHILNFFFN